MQRNQIRFLFLNIGHFLDHFFILIFSSVAALRLTIEWSMEYSSLIPYATPGLIAFGVCAIPAGWIADKWSREAMLVIFFIGIGLSSIYTGFANTPMEIAFSLTLLGTFAAIYHPVGLAMVIKGRSKTGILLAVNGVFGNMGVAFAALITGLLIDHVGWRSAFYIPGVVSIVLGLVYLLFERNGRKTEISTETLKVTDSKAAIVPKPIFYRVFTVILITTALGGVIFQSTTFALPKVFDERLTDLAGTATLVGIYTFLVFSIAAFAQLVVGYLLDNHSVRNIFAIVAILQAILFAIMMHLTGLSALIVAIAFMLVVFGAIPINDVLVGRMASSEWRSRAYALTYLVSFSVSAIAVPLIAKIHSNWGFDRLFAVLAVLAFLIFIAVIFLPREKQSLSFEFNSRKLKNQPGTGVHG